MNVIVQEAQLQSLQKKARNYSYACSLNIIFIIAFIIHQLQYNLITFNPQLQFNTFEYQLLSDNSFKESEWCFTFAFNQDSTILAAGCKSYIKIYNFANGKTQLNQTLNNISFVRTIYFMKKSQSFISGEEDSTISIWHQNSNKQWFLFQKLIEHSKTIKHVIMNRNEDLIISCSNDKTIKFWIKQNEWICSQTISNHTSSVLSLSINESQDKLISCSEDKSILVMEFSKITNKWVVIQRIFLKEHGRRLSFIGDDQFTFQPKNQDLLQLYEWNATSRIFNLKMLIPVNSTNDLNYYFPQQFITQKQLLINKNGNYINLLRKKSDQTFIQENLIKFNTNQIFGIMNDSGDYLVTWDQDQKQIQFRKFSEL
ncbi:unnamed protein product [Paramecium sonneborni]|uniref:Uncharacterized protein n=1 Tax=Paramecium sonneborni TaxID=65129 RepID=A0A8S1QZD9_9CILI|nr:unnamed protein product [Paramecium sonneborni]CAD8120348.1 unnamed protein product [Paramecium sonneborni]